MNEKTFILRSRQVIDYCRDYILEAVNFGDLMEVVVRPWKKRRNVEQNALYWAVLTDIAEQVKDEDGRKYSSEVWHSYFKATLLGKDTIIVDGLPVLVEKSTTALNVMDFSDYVTQIQAWAVDHGVRFYDVGGNHG